MLKIKKLIKTFREVWKVSTPSIKTTFIIIGAVVLCLAGTCLSRFIPGLYKDDNVGEEVLEDVIENQTGAKIDLSPFSPEKK